MTISSNANFNVDDSAVVSADVTETVQAAAGFGTGGKGLINHPTLGVYAYDNTPDVIEGIDGAGPIYVPDWIHSQTLGGGADTLWQRDLRDSLVKEIWSRAEVGSTFAHVTTLLLHQKNPPDPEDATPSLRYVQWSPNYITSTSWNVAIVSVTSGGQRITFDQRLKSYGFAPLPVELTMRIISAV